MITTNMGAGGNFWVTATNPAGPWSDPVWIAAPGIDPDLFFDEDGRGVRRVVDVRVARDRHQDREVPVGGTQAVERHRRPVRGRPSHLQEGRVLLPDGGRGAVPKRRTPRRSLAARTSGGPTTRIRRIRSSRTSTRQGRATQFQGVGHADITQAHDGSYWIVFHGYRTVASGAQHTLGRETLRPRR